MQIKWTDEEHAILRLIYPTQGVDGVMSLIPHRSRHAIINRAARMNLTSRKMRQKRNQPKVEPAPAYLAGWGHYV